MHMPPVPWRYVESWSCLACGGCCKGFDVALRFDEWVNVVRTYGAGLTEPRIDRLYLSKKADGTCVFLFSFHDRQLCGLQHMKPKACKLWPFKIYVKPRYCRPNEAVFTAWKKKFFIYVDSLCRGIRWGSPKKEFAQDTLPEFIEIGLGLREKQQYSTSNIPYHPLYLRMREKGRFRRPPPLI